ncbi:MAG: hypothetical protein KAZ87_14110 [Spirochaetes bacterium]|nr:hypothetical protein [Spirochaetota bacterium]
MKIFLAMITLLTYSLLGAKPFNIACNYIPIGINAGVGNNGGVIGAELSFVHLGDGLLYGVFFVNLQCKVINH